MKNAIVVRHLAESLWEVKHWEGVNTGWVVDEVQVPEGCLDAAYAAMLTAIGQPVEGDLLKQAIAAYVYSPFECLLFLDPRK